MVLCIPPFNYPVNLAVSKIGPALMAGNTVVMKPPTQGAVAGCHMMQVPDYCLSVPLGRLSTLTLIASFLVGALSTSQQG